MKLSETFNHYYCNEAMHDSQDEYETPAIKEKDFHFLSRFVKKSIPILNEGNHLYSQKHYLRITCTSFCLPGKEKVFDMLFLFKS